MALYNPSGEIDHLNPSQTIEHTHVHIQHCLMLQTATENENRISCEKTLLYILPQNKKNYGLESGARERREKSVGKKGKNRRVWGTALASTGQCKNAHSEKP